MSGIEFFRSFMQQATTRASRSTALNPLGWALGILLSAMVLAGRIPDRPAWLLPLLGVFVGGFVVAYMAAYFILLFKNPDALRSERFTLSKMALEKSVTGDSLAGFTALELGDGKIFDAKTEPTEQEGPQ